MSGSLLKGSELGQALDLRTHTLVVGSGSGGAVVAQILATHGVETLILEEGGAFQAGDFSQRDEQMWPALYRERAQQLSADGLINVLQGSCFGGSSVINTADCEPTPPEVYAHWRRHHGLAGIDEETLAPSQARVFEMLGVTPIRPDEINRNNDLLEEGARRLGWRHGSFLHNRRGCVGSGYCLIGCAYDAKRGAHLNYLPAALAAGAGAVTDARVERLERDVGGHWVVHGTLVEPVSRTARLPLRVRAERVVLAAGAVHSPAILYASGFAPGLPQLGRNLSLQPQMTVHALFPDEAGPVVAWRGIPQASFCDEFDDHGEGHGLGGFRLEAISGGMSMIGSGLPGLGHAHKELMTRVSRSALSLLLVPDQPSGRITWLDRGERGPGAVIEYRMSGEWQERLRRGLRMAAELYFAAGAEEVGYASEIFPPLRSPDELDRALEFPIRTGVTRFISAHVQGTCRMAPDAARGVVDLEHRVHGLPGLYVVDASVVPTTASTHTMIPVMTLADRAAHRMLEGDARPA